MNSTLKPGKVSDTIRRLRNSAIKEMDKPEANARPAGEISFDRASRVTPKPFDIDMPLDTGVYMGPHSPHIGNGSGAPIGSGNPL